MPPPRLRVKVVTKNYTLTSAIEALPSTAPHKMQVHLPIFEIADSSAGAIWRSQHIVGNRSMKKHD